MTAVPQQAPGGSARHLRKLVDGWGALVLPVTAFLLAVFVYPLAGMLARSLSDPAPGLGNYAAFFDSPVYTRVLVNTFTTSALVTLVTLLLGFPYAYLMTLARPFWRGVLMAAVLVPFWTSLLVRTFAWVLILRDTGVLNDLIPGPPVPLLRNLPGVLIGMVQVMLPFAVLPIYATMRSIDRRLLQAAEGLGARPAFAFWRVYAPLTAPGVAAATLLVFVSSLGFYVTPALLGGPKNVMIGELIVQQLSGVLRWGFASALAVILLVVTGALLLLASRLVDLRRLLR
ncbi:ABC transporter permease [Nonomuraea sediminis]|uniref:ABC transporter permease n=1 Tax=Nonomuraea sediminis TaxID=2835864 RepID=UPI0027DEBE5E|nr:ABC transporter permease [Nonomuraea sediminis]